MHTSIPPLEPGRARLLRRSAIAAVVTSLCLAAENNAHTAPANALLAQLRTTIGTSRLIGPRLTVSRGYQPCVAAAGAYPDTLPPTCGTAAPPSRRIARLSTRAAAAVQESAHPDALHALAIIDLLWADREGKTINRSISHLQRAARLSDRPAPILADLAAALIVRAARTQTPRDLLDAIQAADSAAFLEPANLAARHNLALALDRLGVDGQAERAWKAYAALGKKDGWRREARERATALGLARGHPPRPGAGASTTTLARYAAAAPQDARRWGWEDLLDRWGAAVLRGDEAGAELPLRAAEALGAELERRGGDGTLAQAVRAIRATRAGTTDRQALARVHRHTAVAHRTFGELKFDSMAVHARAALATPAQSSAPRQWARHYLGVAGVVDGEWAETEALYADLLSEVDSLRSPALVGNAYVIWGTALLRTGRYQDARDRYQKASRALARTGEREQLGKVEYMLASTEFELGITADAYASAHRCLRVLRGEHSSRWLHSMATVMAENAAREGLMRTAALLLDEGIAVAERAGEPYVVEGLVRRAQLRIATGDTARAAGDLTRAEGLIRDLREGQIQTWLVADLRESRASSLVRAAPRQAMARLDSVIAVPGGSRTPIRLLRAFVARAGARLASGDAPGATRDMDRAAAIVRENADSVRAAPLRSSLLRNARGVFDRLVMLQIARGDTARALRTMDWSPLPRRSGPGGGETGEGWRVPRGTVAVAYALVGDTLLAWTVSGDGVRLTRATVPRDTLARRIERVRSLLELGAPPSTLRPRLAELYDVLLRPLADRLKGAEELVLIPDGELSDVPFAALYDRAAGRYLMETHVVRLGASLRGVAGPRRAGGSGQAVFAAPAYGPGAHPGLQALPLAAAEVRTVAALYPGARVLNGSARRGALEGALREASVFHFAGHAVLDEERPERSFLALTPAARGDSASLTVAEIEAMDLRHLRLVVLSACETLRARGGRSPGTRGLGTALVDAGAAGVVGSLWRVDDTLTQALMVEFHVAYRRTGSAPAALRHAQLRMLRSGDPGRASPAAWAGFQYTGI